MYRWTDFEGRFSAADPYPPCNLATFVVGPGSNLTLIGEGQGVLMMVNVTADEESTVNITVSDGDWGLFWADINAADANELDITVQGEGVLWDTNIECPEATTVGTNCKITLQCRYSDKGLPIFVLDPEVLVPAQSTGEK